MVHCDCEYHKSMVSAKAVEPVSLQRQLIQKKIFIKFCIFNQSMEHRYLINLYDGEPSLGINNCSKKLIHIFPHRYLWFTVIVNTIKEWFPLKL
jgi:hypothetical protein